MPKQTYNRAIEVTFLGQDLGLLCEALEFNELVLCVILAVRRWRTTRRRIRIRRISTVTTTTTKVECIYIYIRKCMMLFSLDGRS
jgi:hypothetical protein